MAVTQCPPKYAPAWGDQNPKIYGITRPVIIKKVGCKYCSKMKHFVPRVVVAMVRFLIITFCALKAQVAATFRTFAV